MSETTSSESQPKQNGKSHDDSNKNTENEAHRRAKRKARRMKKEEEAARNEELEELDVEAPAPPKVKRKKKKAQAPVEEVPLRPPPAPEPAIEELTTASDLDLSSSLISDGEAFDSDGSVGSSKQKHHLRDKLLLRKHKKHENGENLKGYSQISTGPNSARSAHERDEEEALANLLKATTSPTTSRDPSRDPGELNAADYLRSIVSGGGGAPPLLGAGVIGSATGNSVGSPAPKLAYTHPQMSIEQLRGDDGNTDEPFSDSQAHLVDSAGPTPERENGRSAAGDASTIPQSPVISPDEGSPAPGGKGGRSPTITSPAPMARGGTFLYQPPPLPRLGTAVSPADLKRQATMAPQAVAATSSPRDMQKEAHDHGVLPRTASPAASSSSAQQSHSDAEGANHSSNGDSGKAVANGDGAAGAEGVDSNIPPANAAPFIKSSNPHSSELGQYFYSRMHGSNVKENKLAGERQKEMDKQAKKKEKRLAKLKKHHKPEPGHEFDHILGGATEGETTDRIEQGTAGSHLPAALNPHLLPEHDDQLKAKEKMKFNRDDGRFKYKGSVVRIPIADDKREDYEITKFSHNSWSGVRYYWVPDGQGRLSYITGEAQYIGEWKKGVRHGFGEGSCECKSVEGIYQGEWKNGKPGGQGKFLTKKFTFDGSWKDGHRHGFGDYHTERLRYVGDWLDDKKNGYGIITYDDGTRYEGEWEKDQRQGFGVCRYPDGSIYTGEWADNQRQGTGTSIYANGNRYVGEWYKDMKQGQGSLFGALHQKLYEGNWWRNKRHGEGTAWFVDTGDRYEGEWFLGKQHGEGDWFGADGSSYKGSYVDGFRQGTGLAIYASGDRYVGEWARGSREGTLCAYVYKVRFFLLFFFSLFLALLLKIFHNTPANSLLILSNSVCFSEHQTWHRL